MDFRRATRPASRSRNEGPDRGDFRVPWGRLFYAPGTKGGGIILSNNGTLPYFYIPLILSGLSPYSSPHAGRSAKIRGDDSDPPPETGFPCGPA